MSVETRMESRFWYGRWQRNSRRYCKRLKVRVAGAPGSDEYEQSRIDAEEALAALIAETDRSSQPEELVQKVHEVKFGRRISSIRLSKLEEEWLALPRPRPLSKGRITYTRSVFNSFIDFVRTNHPKLQEMAGVTPEIAEAYMAAQEARGISGRTYNAMLSLLRGACERLRVRAGMISNPFKDRLVMKEENSAPRQPFTLDELERLFAAATSDPEIHALLVTGVCTALRRGDACCLKWDDVNLNTNRIRVVTRKTGEKVAIPIFPKLRTILLARPRRGSPYVFPTLAESYLREANSLNNRINSAFARAGLRGDTAAGTRIALPAIDIPDNDDLRTVVLNKLKALTDKSASSQIRRTMIEVFDLYSSGTTLPDIARQLGISKGSASNYLARIERVAGHPIVRSKVKAAREGRLTSGGTQTERPNEIGKPEKRRLINVNSRGFHAFRATFTTQALAAGVPVEVVKLITGHSTTETVLKHYFNPDEQTLYKAVETVMPDLLTATRGKTRQQELLELIDSASPKTAMTVLRRIRALIQDGV